MRKSCSQASLVSSADSAAIYSLLKNSATFRTTPLERIIPTCVTDKTCARLA